jgi:biopolymer transport protein ExbD
MKRKKHTSAEDEAQIDMTPMLDIVFIMLIFFIVTTSFVKEKGLDVNRPEDNQAKNDQPSKALSIRIAADGTIMMGGREVDIRRVVANTQTYLAENNTDSAAIQAHEDSEHGTVVEVMNQVKIAGIDKVSVLVKKKS